MSRRKKGDDRPPVSLRYIPIESLAPSDMPGKQSGANRYLFTEGRRMGEELARRGEAMPTREQALRMLQHRTGVALPRGRKK